MSSNAAQSAQTVDLVQPNEDGPDPIHNEEVVPENSDFLELRVLPSMSERYHGTQYVTTVYGQKGRTTADHEASDDIEHLHKVLTAVTSDAANNGDNLEEFCNDLCVHTRICGFDSLLSIKVVHASEDLQDGQWTKLPSLGARVYAWFGPKRRKEGKGEEAIQGSEGGSTTEPIRETSGRSHSMPPGLSGA